MTATAASRTGRRGADALFSVKARDGMRAWTVGSLVVAAAAAVFAVVGAPRVPVMWPLYRLGIVLPGCGLTRGVVALADGDVAGAWRWNPASPLVALGVAAGVVRAGAGSATGRWLTVRIASRWWMVASGVAAVALLWVNQWSHAELLMGGR